MKTIIVATDFSPNADNALQYAGALAAVTKAKIILFNAFQLPLHASNTLLSPSAIDELLQANKERLEKMALEMANEREIEIEVQTKLDNVTDALEELAAQSKADLVVIGMHANDWSDKLFGNTATAIISTAEYPVLVVPESVSFTGVNKILYAYDENFSCIQNKFSVLKQLASSFEAEIQVFHVEKPIQQQVANGEQEDEFWEIENALEAVKHSYKEVEQQDVLAGIQKEIQEFGASMLVMVPHKLGWWQSLFHQSNTRAMALKTHIPLLVLPESDMFEKN